MIYLRKCDDLNGCGKTYPGDLDNCPNCGVGHEFSDPAPVNPRDYCYDEETYPNAFTCRITHVATDTRWKFEISDRVNQVDAFVTFILALRDCGARMVGYNNVGFDYIVLHYIMMNQHVEARQIYDKAMSVIRGGDKFGHMIWDRDQIVEQLDLYKVRHFDNMARATSLKSLEIAMRMDNIEDLPFPVGTVLTSDQIDTLLIYNDHDVTATCYFYVRTLPEIEFREVLTERYGRNFMNHNDTKIGKDYFIMELEKNGVECYVKTAGGRQPRQTLRPSICLGDVLFDYVKFEQPEFERIRQYLSNKTITETKGVFKDLNATIDGLSYVFGVGGLHASVPSQVVYSDDDYQIVDVDVASYYPNLAIKNRLFPAHLGDVFCDIYLDVYEQRKSHAKGTPENAMLKLALNGVYGDSNNVYSPFYDPFYTMSITINGQMLLCMLVEQLIKIPGLTMVQCNTDGVTFRCPRQYMEHQRTVCKWWENVTLLELEEALYSRFIVRDVNNYIAEYEGGELKRKGAYEYNLQWHQDQSALVVPKAAEAALVHGKDIREFIENHDDDYDFMCRAKVPRSNNLMMRWPEYDNAEIELASIVRYYVSKDGGTLVKVAPPTGELGTWKRATKVSDTLYEQVMMEIIGSPEPALDVDTAGTPHDTRIHTKNKSKHTIREMGICVGWRVTDCSDVKNFDRSTLNYDYYVAEAEKLVKPLLTNAS